MKTIKELKTLLEFKIHSAERIIIVPHVNIDYDAIASSLGLSLICKKLKKNAYILINDDISRMDVKLISILENAQNMGFNIINYDAYEKSKKKKELFILTDVNKRNLLCLKDELSNRNNIVIIDHHDTDQYTVDAKYNYINKDISSASEIVARLFKRFKIKCSSDIANYLLTGIHLDTHRLSKKNTSPKTLKTCAYLIENGASLDVVNDFFSEDFVSNRKVQRLLNETEFIQYKIAVITADNDDIYSIEEVAKTADSGLLFENVDASIVIARTDENTVSLSARSKERIDVSEIMKELNGGGHSASAATRLTDCSTEDAQKRLIKTIKPDFCKY